MKTTLIYSQSPFGKVAWISKLSLRLTVSFLAVNNALFAGSGPIIKHNSQYVSKTKDHTVRYINKSDLNGNSKRPGILTLPVISYPGPQAYTAGVAITALQPTGSGVAAVGYSTVPVTIGSGFAQNAYNVAVDALGNVYVVDGGPSIIKIPVGGGSPVNIGAGFAFSSGVAVDAAGNVYVTDVAFGLTKIPAGGGSQVTLATGFDHPQGVAVDAAGNVYVADYSNNVVKKVPAGGGTPVVIGSGYDQPNGVAVDAAGNVYVTDQIHDTVWKIPGGSGAQVSIGSGFSEPVGIAVDAVGNVYVTDPGNNTIKEIPASGGTPVIIGSDINLPRGIAADGAGNIYIADYTSNSVNEIKPVGGYYITPALPAGLVFDGVTGIISGTPMAASPATNYTVTAYNSSGSSSATVSIRVNLPPLPNISYSSPQTYFTNLAITPLTPTGSGVAAVGYSTVPVTIGSGFAQNAYNVAVDALGNVYVVDGGPSIIKIPVGGGSPVNIGAGFAFSSGVAVDAAGNVYVTDVAFGLTKIPAGGGSQVTLATGFDHPQGVAVDAAGNVYVADYSNNVVKKVPAGGGTPVVIGSGYDQPNGVAVDAAGNVYVTDQIHDTVWKIPGGSGAQVSIGSGFSEPVGIAVDAVGNVYVTDPGNNTIKEIPASGGTPVIIGSDINLPRGIAADGAGNIYIADYTSNSVNEIKPVGGYYITPALPAGLVFDGVTGIISGTPIAASPATKYTVTAYNIAGGTQATGNIKVNAFSISYTSPHTYTIGVPIPILSPASSGVATAGYSSNLLTLGSGFHTPAAVAVDAAGNVYVADSFNNAVKKIPVGGGAIVVLGSGFSTPAGIAVDASGNVYVSDVNNNAVKMIPAGSSTPVTIGTGFRNPYGVAEDAAGNVYVADYGNNAVKKILINGGTTITIGSEFNSPLGVAVDASGNVYVADAGSKSVKEIPADGSATVTIGSGYAFPQGVAVDDGGNVYVADRSGNTIYKIPFGGGTQVTLTSGLSGPSGLAFDAVGNMYIANQTDSEINEIKPVGGYYISAFLPAGLSFSSNTGVISGTPTVSSPATNYTVTAYNAFGNSPATVNINIIANANLSGLNLSSGSLKPAFATGTTNYTASVGNPTASITVTPTTSDPVATVKVNGMTVTSTTASPAIALNVGTNTIKTIVTAQDGTTTKTYTVTVTRAALTNANLSILKLSNGALSPVFAQATAAYTASVANNVSSIMLTPTTSDVNATVKVNGVAVMSGTASMAIPLTAGPNTITTIVTAQNGTTTKTYTVIVTRAVSNNANLAKLGPSVSGLTPSFSGGTTSYALSVSNATASMTLTPVSSYANATIKVNGTAVTSGTATAPIALTEGGQTVITTVVTAQDGTTTKTYTLTVTRAVSTNASLSALKLGSGTLTPAFVTATISYNASVANSISTITITPTTTDANATIKVNSMAVTSGTASSPIALAEGAQTVISTVVTAQDGSTTKTYTVTVTRAPSTNASLSKLGPNISGLTPVFSSSTTSYTISTGNATASIKLTPVSSDANATIKVNGTSVASGTTTAPIALAVGPNTITTAVTAQDGTTTKTYTLTVTRASGGADSYVPIAIGTGISVTKPTETPLLAGDGIQVHQAISPNGDGVNDFLQIDNIGQYPDNKLSIMNRNGQLVYEASGYDNSSKVFDGHSNKNGQMQLPGTYFYQLDYMANGIVKHKTGFIVLKY